MRIWIYQIYNYVAQDKISVKNLGFYRPYYNYKPKYSGETFRLYRNSNRPPVGKRISIQEFIDMVEKL